MKIVFLDRDGVINRFPGKGMYVTRVEDFHFLPQTLDAVKRLTEAGCEIHVVSNQGCVSRGLIADEVLMEMTQKMTDQIKRHGGHIQKIHYCKHQTSDNCECRKPKIKLFRDVLHGRNIDLREVYFVGDSAEDMKAGKDLGCRTVLVLSGRNAAEDVAGLPDQPEIVLKDLGEAAEWILQKRS